MKIDDISNWQAFYQVAKHGSFTQAASEMQCGVANVSKRLGRLEEALGVKLLQRTTRRISLTHDGEELLPRVESILAELLALESHFEPKGELTGTIRIACLPSLSRQFLSPVLARFSEQHPKLKFDVQLSDEIVDLVDNQIDIAIRAHGTTDSGLVLRKLCPMKIKLCAAPSYLKKSPKLRTPQDLSQHRILMLPAHRRCKFEGHEFKLGDFFDNVTVHCKAGSFLTELALEGYGIVARADWDVASHLASGSLVEILPKFPLETYGHVFAAIPTRKLLSQRVRLFLNSLMPWARSFSV